MIYCARTWLSLIYDVLRRRLLAKDIVQADETEVQVMRGPWRKAQTKSYMWLYRAGKHMEHSIILYEYQTERDGSYPLNFLRGFKGYLQTAGYVGNDTLPDVIHVE